MLDLTARRKKYNQSVSIYVITKSKISWITNQKLREWISEKALQKEHGIFMAILSYQIINDDQIVI